MFDEFFLFSTIAEAVHHGTHNDLENFVKDSNERFNDKIDILMGEQLTTLTDIPRNRLNF